MSRCREGGVATGRVIARLLLARLLVTSLGCPLSVLPLGCHMQGNDLPSSTKLLTAYPRVPVHSPCPRTAFPGGPLVTVQRANTLGQRRRRLLCPLTLSTLAMHSIRHASTVT